MHYEAMEDSSLVIWVLFPTVSNSGQVYIWRMRFQSLHSRAPSAINNNFILVGFEIVWESYLNAHIYGTLIFPFLCTLVDKT